MRVTVTTMLHVCAGTNGEPPTYKFFPFDMSKYGDACVGERTVEVNVPDDFDPIKPIIAALRKEQQDIRAELTGKVNKIEERIQSLLAIEGPK